MVISSVLNLESTPVKDISDGFHSPSKTGSGKRSDQPVMIIQNSFSSLSGSINLDNSGIDCPESSRLGGSANALTGNAENCVADPEIPAAVVEVASSFSAVEIAAVDKVMKAGVVGAIPSTGTTPVLVPEAIGDGEKVSAKRKKKKKKKKSPAEETRPKETANAVTTSYWPAYSYFRSKKERVGDLNLDPSCPAYFSDESGDNYTLSDVEGKAIERSKNKKQNIIPFHMVTRGIRVPVKW